MIAVWVVLAILAEIGLGWAVGTYLHRRTAPWDAEQNRDDTCQQEQS